MCSNDDDIGSQELVCASFREKEGAITALHPDIVIVFQVQNCNGQAIRSRKFCGTYEVLTLNEMEMQLFPLSRKTKIIVIFFSVYVP